MTHTMIDGMTGRPVKSPPFLYDALLIDAVDRGRVAVGEWRRVAMTSAHMHAHTPPRTPTCGALRQRRGSDRRFGTGPGNEGSRVRDAALVVDHVSSRLCV